MNALLPVKVGLIIAAASVTPVYSQRGEIIIPAAKMAAAEQMAEAPAPGKWWLNRNAQAWGAMNGTILMTGQPSEETLKTGFWDVIPMFRFVSARVPDLVVDPKATGWYRIHVGLYRDDIDDWSPPMLQGKISGERFPDKDPEVQEHLSGYLRLFLVELRQAIGKDIEISIRSSGPDNYALRGKEWIEAGLIDTIIDGQWYSGNGPRPTIDATVAAAGSRGKAMAAAEMSNVDPKKNWQPIKGGVLSPAAIEALAKAYSGRGVAAFGLYESTVHTWSPDARRAIRAAGWDYKP